MFNQIELKQIELFHLVSKIRLVLFDNEPISLIWDLVLFGYDLILPTFNQ